MKVTCYAAGIIGASWATNFALKGCEVTVFDVKCEFLAQAKKQILHNFEYLLQLGCLTSEVVSNALSNISYTTDVEKALKNAQFIQESAPEKLSLKKEIVALFDRYAPNDCIVASSTSGLRITDIAEESSHPDRYIGAHPFNPPHLIPLVEITKGKHTTQEIVERSLNFYRAMGKEPIVLNKEKLGFVANRLSHTVLREVISLVEEGVCSVEDADKALVYGPGLRWASVGQIMIAELGTQGGVRAGIERFAPLNESIFEDLENRTKVPQDWATTAEKGIAQEKEHRPECIGQTTEQIAAFRDRVLVTLLRLHGKL